MGVRLETIGNRTGNRARAGGGGVRAAESQAFQVVDEALGVGSRSGFPNAAGWSNFAGREPLLGRPAMDAHPFRRWTMAVGRRHLDSNSSEAIAIRGTDDELGLG